MKSGLGWVCRKHEMDGKKRGIHGPTPGSSIRLWGWITYETSPAARLGPRWAETEEPASAPLAGPLLPVSLRVRVSGFS